MAKFRTNHSRQSKTKGKDTVIRVGLFGAIISALFFIFNQFGGSGTLTTTDTPVPEPTEVRSEAGPDFLPSTTTGNIIHHTYYSLSYDEAHEQAEWVAYVLRRDSLNKPWVKRTNRFEADPLVESSSATHRDYSNSGYDRGHLVPAADMAFNLVAMQETFLMSNISPQSSNFNKGIWRELEELTRNWAKKFKELYVVSGPVLSMEPKGAIGQNEVSVPAAFYKVLVDLSQPEIKGIAFILPNEISYEPLFKYATTIDHVEEVTGIDFFPETLSGELETKMEGTFNIDLWEFNKKKFQDRIKKWNEQ